MKVGIRARGLASRLAVETDSIDSDDTQWEREPLEPLSADGELMAYRRD